MPIFEKHLNFIVRGIQVSLGIEAGVTRDGARESVRGPESARRRGTQDARKLGQLITSRSRALGARARRRLSSEAADGIRPENVIWIFGAARTGSTWLSRMMDDLPGHVVWREPLVGALFGNLYYERAKHLIGKQGKHYILGDGYRDSWLGSIRMFVLREASGRFPEAIGADRYLVVKEPNGSLGAPLLMDALPESRMILLVRDPRDATASSMDAKRKGGWQYENRKKGDQKRTETQADKDPDSFVRDRAKAYLQRITNTKQAYEAHRGPKVMVRYEDLRADALGEMKRIYSSLDIPVDEGQLARVVKQHDWENIPEEEKGEGKVFRKAKPGGWKEDLTPEQVAIVERITAPILEEFYPDRIRLGG